MRTLLQIPLLLAAASGLVAQTQTLCHTPSSTGFDDPLCYYSNLEVTNPHGISLRSIRMDMQWNPGWTLCHMYLRHGGAATFDDITDSSAWWQAGVAFDGGSSQLLFDFSDMYLAPGTYGIALHRDEGWGLKVDGAQTVSDGNLSMTGIGSTDDPFATAPTAATWVGCINYTIGNWRGTVAASASGPGGQLLVNLSSSPPDIHGSTGGFGTFSHTYQPGTDVTLNAPEGSGPLVFHHWEIDGDNQELGEDDVTFEVSQPHSAIAHFQFPHTLSFSATLDGVAIAPDVACSPIDLQGHSSKTAPSSFRFRRDRVVELTADQEYDDRYVFKQWLVDGVPRSSQRGTLRMRMMGDHSVVAEYMDAPCYELDVGTPLGMLDDDVASGLSLGFPFPLDDGTTTDTIDVCSNGYVWLVSSSSNTADPTPSLVEFQNEGARVAPFWADLEFDGGVDSDTYFHAFADRAVITWHEARLAGTSELFTVQCQLFQNGTVWWTWSASTPAAGTVLVGVTEGGGVTGGLAANFWSPGGASSNGYSAWQEFQGNFNLQTLAVALSPYAGAGWRYHRLDCAYAAATSYGSGCGRVAAFYQTGMSVPQDELELSLSASGGYDVLACSGSCFDSALGTLVPMGDDALHTVGLPFSFPFPGNATGSTAISVSSNGFVWLDADQTDGTDFDVNVPEFANEGPRLAPLWVDLNPSDPIADGVYVRVESDRVVVTWHMIPEYNSTELRTAQCQLFADGGVLISRPAGTQTGRAQLLGFSPGFLLTDPTSVDLIADLPLQTGDPATAATLSLSTGGATPVVGSTMPLLVDGIPATATAGFLTVGLGQQNLGLALFGAPGCFLLNTIETTSAFSITGLSATVPYTIPGSPEFYGFSLFVQGVVLAPGENAFGVVTSNGLELQLGEF